MRTKMFIVAAIFISSMSAQARDLSLCAATFYNQRDFNIGQNPKKPANYVRIRTPFRRAFTIFLWEDFFAPVRDEKEDINQETRWRLKDWDEIINEDNERDLSQYLADFVTDKRFQLTKNGYHLINSTASAFVPKAGNQYIFKNIHYLRLVAMLLNDKLQIAALKDDEKLKNTINANLARLQAEIKPLEDLIFNTNYLLHHKLKNRLCADVPPNQKDMCLDYMIDAYYRALDEYDWTQNANFSTFMTLLHSQAAHACREDFYLQKNATTTLAKNISDADADKIENPRNELDDRTNRAETEQDIGQMESVLDVLNERQRKVIIYRYGLDGVERMTLKELGMKIGITKEAVRQTEVRALKILRNTLESRQAG